MQTQQIIVVAVIVVVILGVVLLVGTNSNLPALGTTQSIEVSRQAVEDFTGLDALAFQGLGTSVVGDCRAVVAGEEIQADETKRWLDDATLTRYVGICIDRVPDAGYLDVYIGQGAFVYYLIAYKGVIEDFGPVLRFKLSLVANGPTRAIGMSDNYSIYVIAKGE